MAKHDVFNKELSFIKQDALREYIIDILDNVVPDYFYHIAASSTGKYHPDYALGEGGLVRHTQAAVRIAVGLFPLTEYAENQKDFIVAALILHDTFKLGEHEGRYTRADHPLIAARVYQKYFDDKNLSEVGEVIGNLIVTHMGQWNKDYKTKKEILPIPSNTWQKFVHTCDYLASRKYLEFNFNVEVNRD